jgi:hypothetical protein
MDLQTTNSLDLRVSKEDLIDIIIDEQLTRFEDQLKVQKDQITVYQEQKNALNAKIFADFTKKILKLIPKELNIKVSPTTINYSTGCDSTTITFAFPTYSIQVNGCTKNPEIEKNKPKFAELDKLMAPYIKKRDEIQTQINELNSNNKRIKARMIKSFLTKTKEGKEILGILGETSDKKLLSIKAKH